MYFNKSLYLSTILKVSGGLPKVSAKCSSKLFETKVESKNSVEAAKVFYKNLSEHFNNNVPTFNFTIQKGGSGKGKFYHFQVKEKKSKDNVDYKIQPFEIKNEEEAMKQYLDSFDSFKGRFTGGAKKKGSRRSSRRGSSRSEKESESSEDYYVDAVSYVPTTSTPIYYMYYDPLLYRLDSVYIPTFYAYLAPYVEINTRGLWTYLS
jgi:hypothetical protein